MNIVIGQLNPVVGAVTENLNAMLAIIEQAKANGANLVMFPELAVSGYPPKDLLIYPEFVETCLAVNQRLAEASTDNLLIVWGNIARHERPQGKPLFNAGYCAWDGQIRAMAYKSNLPTYDVFDEARYFESSPVNQAVCRFAFLGRQIALSICEDLWNDPAVTTDEVADITPVLYPSNPLQVLDEHPVDLLLNISASPYVAGKPALRFKLLKRLASARQTPVAYVNQVGATDDLIFDGHSSMTWPSGSQWQAPGFEAGRFSIPDPKTLPEASAATQPDETTELIQAITLGVRDYVEKSVFSKVFIGLSGGIDSALTAALTTRALGPENVVGIAMPGPYSSTHSLEDAEHLARNLNIEFRIHSINQPFQCFLDLLSNGQSLQDLAEQNLQARLRGLVLMTLANREGALVLTTGNKSEIATGYSTLYGDSCGALAPLGDLYKTQVYALAEALNKEVGYDLIPERVLQKPPSAELAPNQKDSDSLPPYPVLDSILVSFIEDQLGFGDLLNLGYDKTVVLQTLQRVMGSEFKRKQMPPALKVSRKAFGSGRMFPIVQQVRFAEPAETLHR